MRLATIATGTPAAGTGPASAAAVLSGDDYLVIDGFTDVGELLATENWEATVAEAVANPAATVPAADAEVLQLITRPGKIICVGLTTAVTSSRWDATCPPIRRCSRSSPRR